MNIQDIIQHIVNGTTPPGYRKVEHGEGMFEFQKEEASGPRLRVSPEDREILRTNAGQEMHRAREREGLDEFRKAMSAMLEKRIGVDFESMLRGDKPGDDAQAQHDAVLEQQREQEAMFERILKTKTFDLGNAHMCELPKFVLKTLQMLLNEAGEASVRQDERDFDNQIDAFNSLCAAVGLKTHN